MNLGFNSHLLSFSKDYRMTGIGLYIKNLLSALYKKNVELTLFSSSLEAKETFPNFQHVISNINTISPNKRILWEQLLAPYILKTQNIDLYHSPMHVVPLLASKKLKNIITVHDLANFKFPQFYTGSKQKYLTTMTKLSVKKADKIIAVSNNTKEDLIDILKVPENKIKVVHNGLNFNPSEITKDSQRLILKKFDIPEDYLLFVGTMEPRKNIEGLLSALQHLWENKQKKYNLVIVGPKGWLYENIENMLEKYNKIGRVIRTGYVDNDELTTLYANCTLFVYPSFYEGFGFPVLEAMSAGAPVLCSSTSSLPEVGGDAVEYVHPNDYKNIAEKIDYLIETPTKLKTMKNAGLVQSKKFSWEKAASETIGAYEEM